MQGGSNTDVAGAADLVIVAAHPYLFAGHGSHAHVFQGQGDIVGIIAAGFLDGLGKHHDGVGKARLGDVVGPDARVGIVPVRDAYGDRPSRAPMKRRREAWPRTPSPGS